MAENTEVFSAKLDNEDFKKKAFECIDALGEIGSPDSLGSLIKNLGSATKLLGTMAVAFYAVKGSIEMVEEAEAIRQINNEFETLTKNAGISGSAMKEGLEKASAGLIDNTDLLKISNKAIIEMGASAKKLPEILELARKSTSLFGGDLAGNFEKINGAISSGNTKALKHMGILIDSDKAYKKYAISIGETVGSLSQAGRQQAIMNEVLSKGGEAFKGVNGDANVTKNTLTQIGVAIGDVKEIFILAFEKTMGPGIRSWLKDLKGLSDWMRDKFVASSDEMADSTRDLGLQLDHVQEKLKEKKKLLAEVAAQEAQYGHTLDQMGGLTSERVEVEIAALVKQKNAILDKDKALAESAKAAAEAAKSGGGGGVEGVDPEKKKAQETAFRKDLLKIKEDELNSREQMEMGLDEFESNLAQKKILEAQALDARITEIRDKQAQGIITEGQANTIIEEEKQSAALKTAALMESLDERKLRALDRLAEKSKNTNDSISAGFKAASMRSQTELKKSSNIGTVAFNSMAKNGKSAFEALGNGSKTAGEAMKGFLLSSIADIAEAQGEFLLASGIGTYNPVQIVQGGALIALGSFLRAQAGGSSSSMGGGGGGGGGGSSSVPDMGKPEEDRPMAAAQEKKHVIINIQHNFDTEQTRQRLVELVRENTDATAFDFNQKIGV